MLSIVKASLFSTVSSYNREDKKTQQAQKRKDLSTMFARMKTEKLVLKPGTRNSWENREKERLTEIDRCDYDRIVDANKFFRSFGSERMYKSYTSHGLIVTRIVSKDPTSTLKTIRTFEIL